MRINVTHKELRPSLFGWQKGFHSLKVIASFLRNFCIKTTKNLLSYNYTLIRNSNKNKTMKTMPILQQVLFIYKLWTVFIQNSILFWHILNLIWYKKFTITFHQMVRFEFQVSTAAKKYVCQSLITFRIKNKRFPRTSKLQCYFPTTVHILLLYWMPFIHIYFKLLFDLY